MITFINVFTVVPENQQDALQAIQRAYTEVVRHQPGFISAQLLVSDDGLRVTAVANWESAEQFAARKQSQGFKDLQNPEFFEAIVSNDAHAYTTAIEVQKPE